MMFTVVYLSAKLGQVSGRGLFQAIPDFLTAAIFAASVGLVASWIM